MEIGLSYLSSVHFPVSVLISIAFAYIFGSMRSAGTTDINLRRLDNLGYLSVYFAAAMLVTNGIYLVSTMVLSSPVILFYSFIPGIMIGYMVSERMSAGSRHISLNRLDSLAWFATWSFSASVVVYLILFGLKQGVSLV